MAKQNIVNLAEWYTNEEAVEQLSKNAGRPVDRNYPRTLARYGKIRSLDLGQRNKLYHKGDVNRYVVSSKRGKKPKSQAPAASR